MSIEKWHVDARRDEGNEQIGDAVPEKHYSKVVDLSRSRKHCDRGHERSCQGQGNRKRRHLNEINLSEMMITYGTITDEVGIFIGYRVVF